MSDEQPPPPERPLDTQRVEPHDPRRRLRELLAIPDRDRTDATWDEIIALEIQLAPGNRAQSPQENGNRNQDPGRRPGQQGRRPDQGRRQDPTSRTKSSAPFHKRPRRGLRTPMGGK